MINLDDVFSIEDITPLNEDLLLEMANLDHRRTGLPYDIWIDSVGADRNNTHNSPRIKVKVDGKFIPFEISEDPDIPESVKKTGLTDFPHKNKIREYVIAYRKVFLAHYFKQITDADALNMLKTLRRAPEAEEQLELLINEWPNLRVEYKWDEDELLYVINVLSDNGLIETIYAMDNMYLSREMNLLRVKYGPVEFINLDGKWQDN